MNLLKKSVMLALLPALFFSGSAWATAKIDPALTDFVRANSATNKARISVLMAPAITENAPRKYDGPNVIAFLRKSALAGWNKVAQYMSGQHLAATDFQRVGLYAVNSSFVVDVTAAGLRAVAEAPGVQKIYANRKVQLVQPKRGRFLPPTDGIAGSLPYDWKDTGLDKMIATKGAPTGAGVILGHVDTGVDGSHPALKGKILMFFDASKKKVTEPFDADTHGTHTAGTMVGGDWQTNPIGMAPQAKLISSAALDGYDSMLAGMEFMLSPDGNPASKMKPRAISNSWNTGGAPDQELFYRAISAWEAAGILPVFSAGNNGPSPATITPPHENPLAFAIGATGADGKVTSFSSRGPGNFHGQPTQKPDITAPGDNIRSSVPGGKYEEMSGTSMATPHVTGMTAFLFQANPALTPDQVRAILIKSASPKDANGNPTQAGTWNANYGYGKLDIFNAVKMAMNVNMRPLRDMLSAISFVSPADQDEEEVANLSVDSARDVLSYPAALEGTDWTTIDKIDQL